MCERVYVSVLVLLRHRITAAGKRQIVITAQICCAIARTTSAFVRRLHNAEFYFDNQLLSNKYAARRPNDDINPPPHAGSAACLQTDTHTHLSLA